MLKIIGKPNDNNLITTINTKLKTDNTKLKTDNKNKT